MRVSFGNRLLAAGLAAFAGHGGAAQAEGLPFARAFATDHAPARLHVRVLYRGEGGGVHEMNLWRSGDRFLRRDTDRRLTMIVTHSPRDLAYRLDLFDHSRRLHTIIDRESLYQVGTFTDWSGLAYGLQAPKGRYTLRAVAAPQTAHSVARCDWFELAQPGRTTRICWSGTAAFPILIVDAAGKIVWRVAEIDRDPLPSTIFRPHLTGYTLNDAAQDMKRD